MRKTYPYLQENYYPNLNEEQEKRHFLSLLDDFVNQKQYVKMTLLDWQENPLKDIEGEITSGSISKDGNSSVRRTGSLTCSVDAGAYNVEVLKMDYSLNKKIFIEIGIKNETDEYTDYPILWFPQGVFYITDFSMNSSTTSAVNISLSLKDKMCLLNGDVGGKLPATVQFDVMDTQLSTGEWVSQKVLIYNIILELLNHYGGEDLNNIIIQDVPLRIRRIVKWDGTNPVYDIGEDTEDGLQHMFVTKEPVGTAYTMYQQGDDIGYVYDDFVCTSELVGSTGSTICSVLDTLKNMLGNYEYFYDEMGIFHFREIKNYLNITQAEIVDEEMTNSGRYVRTNEGNFLLDKASEKQYLIETTNEKIMYGFKDNKNITSITVTPQYGNIKNDYIVEGIRQGTSDDISYLVRYHLAIDSKPEGIEKDDKTYYGSFENVVYYTDPTDNLNKLAVWTEVDELPAVGNFNVIYYVGTEDTFYYWDNSVFKKLTYIDDNDEEQPAIKYEEYKVYDWRTYLYLYGLNATSGTDAGRYFEELNAFWPREYDLRQDKQCFFGENEDKSVAFRSLATGNYYLDFIDENTSALGEYSVNNIGVRSDVVSDEEVNCLFQPEIPNVVFLNIDDVTANWSENTTVDSDVVYSPKELSEILEAQKQECVDNSQPYTQVHQEFYSNLSTGGYSNGAYDLIKYELFCHTRYQKTASITALPVFYLEPNSRVELSDRTTNTYGDFMVQSVSLTLGPGANMSVVLNEVAERL